MFDSNQFFSGGAAGFYPLTIDQSLRFNDDDSAYLSRTPASAGNRKTWTWSGWVKRGNISTDQMLFNSYGSSSDRTQLQFDSSGNIHFFDRVGGTTQSDKISSAVYRDSSAWYHIVLAVDTTQATDEDRAKIYINGERITAWGTNEKHGLNDNTAINVLGRQQLIGTYGGGGFYFDGYLAEVHFTDGTAYDADAFGELKSGVWVAKAPSVTYGTNGFYLDFANSADIGNDISGNGNDWTPNNFTASDVVLDSPTDNFCVMNPINPEGDAPLSDGNLVVGSTTDNYSLGTMLIPSTGKWYFEALVEQQGSTTAIGIQKADGLVNDGALQDADNLVFTNLQRLYGAASGTYISYGSAYSVNDVIGVAINMDDGELTFYIDNVSQGTKNATDLSIDIRDYEWVAKLGAYNVNGRLRADFGQSGFTYTPPTGYLALSTANLPDPVIDPAQSASPEDYFNTVLWTGNGTSQSITGVGFQPDFVWIKSRSGAFQHHWKDVLRGTTKRLSSSETNAEETNTNSLTSFDADGYSLGLNTEVNGGSTTYVGWNWKANGSGVANNVGSITSTVSANTTSGFSIVSWTDVGNSADTVGHGLTQAPAFIAWKTRGTTGDWLVNVDVSGSRYGLVLNSTAASSAGNLLTAPTSSVISTWNQNTTMIAYCFHSVEGFSKFGSYTGNGSTDGPFVYTGFRPAFVLFKKTNITTASWAIRDNTRYTYNPTRNTLYPDKSDAEYTGTAHDIDFLSNGFKPRTTDGLFNSSGATYIYMAFAENPFKFSTAS